MDKIIEKAKELKSSLGELEEFKEYFRLKALYDSNEEIKSLLIQLNSLDKNSQQYKCVLDEYNSHPLVTNFHHAKDEVAAILKTIKDILDK